MAGVTRVATRYLGLDEEPIGPVTDILKEGSNDRLKEFIRHLSESEEAKLNHFLTYLTFGDHIHIHEMK